MLLVIAPTHDASGTCSWDEATHGRPHANDARACDDETSWSPHDGAGLAQNDWTRQIKRPPGITFILFVLLHQWTMVLGL